MLSLDQLRNSIAGLAKLDGQDRVTAGVKEIFFDILYADQPLYLAYLGGAPILTQTSADPRHTYLRLFSHKGVAERFVSRNPEAEIREMDVLGILYVGKWALLSGGYGYVLNEGDKWVGMQIPYLIQLFFERVYNEPALFEANCANLLLFFSELARNSQFHYAAECSEAGEWTGLIRAMDQDAGPIGQPLSLTSLFHVPTDTVHIMTEWADISIDASLLRGGLAYYGFDPDADAASFPSVFADTPIPAKILSAPDDISDISIVFPAEASCEEPTARGDGRDAGRVEAGGDQETAKESRTVSAILTCALASAKSRFFKLVHTVAAKSESVICALKGEVGEGHPGKNDSTEDSEEEQPSARQSEIRTVGTVQKRSRRLIAASLACVILLSICVSSIVLFHHVQYKNNYEKFCSYVNDRQYGNAYLLYQDPGFGSDANAYLSSHLDSLVIQYARNELGAEELFAAMRALASFPSLEQDLELSKLAASKLETSKNAYVEGKSSVDVYTRLNQWRQVIDLDAVNYAAVQEDVVTNEAAYISTLDSAISDYSTRIRSFAKARYEVLAYWYPDSEVTKYWMATYKEENQAPLSFYPIAIYSISTQQDISGYWSLTIAWRNTSVKTIQSICFSVVAIDENGQFLTNSDAAGNWVVFDATDSCPYKPDEGPGQSNYGWRNAFHNPFIARIQLTGVNIHYTDGSTTSFTDQVDLVNIQH